jgi:hypothetical protein
MIWPWTKLDTPFSLPSREYSPELPPDAYTWEDWHRDVKAASPYRYFLQKTLTGWLRCNVAAPVKHFWHWVKSHTTRQHHWLDLRCPAHGIEYSYGWLDRDIAMLAASFKLLSQFMEEEFEPSTDPNARSAAVEHELVVLYRWWKHDRKAAWGRYWAEADRLHREHVKSSSPEYAAHMDQAHQLERQDDEMLLRLVTIRKYLWS